MWKRLTKNERNRISNLDQLHNRIENLERDLRRFQSDYDEVFDYIREQGEVSWTETAKHFERCEHCGYDYNGPQAESHFNWSHQECPVAFIKNCEEFINETGNGNSTRSLIHSLFDEIKAHGDMESEARDFHYVMVDFETEGVPEDFDEYLKVSDKTMEEVVMDGLWGYAGDGRDYINRRIVDYWIQDFERDIGPLPPLAVHI
jgi:hypothetical protein